MEILLKVGKEYGSQRFGKIKYPTDRGIPRVFVIVEAQWCRAQTEVTRKVAGCYAFTNSFRNSQGLIRTQKLCHRYLASDRNSKDLAGPACRDHVSAVESTTSCNDMVQDSHLQAIVSEENKKMARSSVRSAQSTSLLDQLVKSQSKCIRLTRIVYTQTEQRYLKPNSTQQHSTLQEKPSTKQQSQPEVRGFQSLGRHSTTRRSGNTACGASGLGSS